MSVDKFYRLAGHARSVRLEEWPKYERDLFAAADAALRAGADAGDVYLTLLRAVNDEPPDPEKGRRRAAAVGEGKKLPERVRRALAQAEYERLTNNNTKEEWE